MPLIDSLFRQTFSGAHHHPSIQSHVKALTVVPPAGVPVPNNLSPIIGNPATLRGVKSLLPVIVILEHNNDGRLLCSKTVLGGALSIVAPFPPNPVLRQLASSGHPRLASSCQKTKNHIRGYER